MLLSRKSSFFSSQLIILIGLIILGCLVYAKSLGFELVYLDDNYWVNDYRWPAHTFPQIVNFFTSPDPISKNFYRPLIKLSFILNTYGGQERLWIYHLTNLLIHLVNACLVFILFKEFGYHRRMSFLLASIFTVHPMLAQSVVWIPGRTDSLMALPIFLSFIFLLKFENQGKRWFLIGHYLCWLLALMTKETALIFPAACLTYLYFIRRERLLRLLLLSLPWLIIAISWWFIRKKFITSDIASSTFWPYLKYNAQGLFFFLAKVFFPFNMPGMIIKPDMKMIEAVIVLGLVTFLLFLSKKRTRYILFALAWYIIFSLPAMATTMLFYEYRFYVPIIGALMILMEINLGKIRRGPWAESDAASPPKARRSISAVAVLLIVVLAVASFYYSDTYKDRWTFWQNAVKTSPQLSLAHNNLGSMFFLKDDLDHAEEEYKKALALNPEEPMAHLNLGIIYMKKGFYTASEEEYKKEIAIYPEMANAYYNWGVLKMSQGQNYQAEILWLKTIELNPIHITANQNLALYYFAEHNFSQARYYVQQMRAKGIPVPSALEGL